MDRLAWAKPGKALLAALALMATSSCATPGQHEERRAVLVEPSPDVHGALHDAVSSALNQDEITLARDALTESSILLIERARHQTMQGRPGTGRLTEPPERFTLWKRGDDCAPTARYSTGEGRYLPANGPLPRSALRSIDLRSQRRRAATYPISFRMRSANAASS
ncbi:MAG: hypothetical protein U5O39_01790 [Gammaproteobacteria bacterium]|nr:hypothetical protein [Gammaproteobacteria bacterium]